MAMAEHTVVDPLSGEVTVRHYDVETGYDETIISHSMTQFVQRLIRDKGRPHEEVRKDFIFGPNRTKDGDPTPSKR